MPAVFCVRMCVCGIPKKIKIKKIRQKPEPKAKVKTTKVRSYTNEMKNAQEFIGDGSGSSAFMHTRTHTRSKATKNELVALT